VTPSFVPDEARSLRVHFMVGGLGLLAVSAWAVADEVWTRRPWKAHQAAFLELRPDAPGPAIQQLVVPELGIMDRCTTCHAGVDEPGLEGNDVPAVLRTHPNRDLLLGAHPPARFGCTSCHLGQGPALTAGSAHGDQDPLWPSPLLEDVQASCARCHTADLAAPGADRYAAGREQFVQLGCPGCHTTGVTDDEPPRGPSLRHVGQKLYAGALLAWIREPTPRQSRRRMPDFWPGADTDPAMAQRRDDESLAMAAYLIARSSPLPDAVSPAPADTAPETAPGERDGRWLFDRVGCRGCHELGLTGGDNTDQDDILIGKAAASAGDAWGDFGGFGGGEEEEEEPEVLPIDFAPALGQTGARIQAPYLLAWLQDPSAVQSAARMPDMDLSPRDARALATWLSGLSADARPPTPSELDAPDPELVARGQTLIADYACFGCHDIPGFEDEGRAGPELSRFGTKDARELFFGDAQIEHTWETWTTLKLREPRAVETEQVAQTMPDYGLDLAAVPELGVFLRSLGLASPPAAWLAPPSTPPAVATAERILRERNCAGCHSLSADQDGDIARYYSETALAPPSLVHEGARVQPQWLYSFLREPRPLRPWLDIRMPKFRLTEDEAAALTTLFGHRSNVPTPFRALDLAPITTERAAMGDQLFTELKCITCHQLAAGSDAAAADLAPDLGLARQRLDPAWVRAFLQDPGALLPETRMPQFFPEGQSPVPELLDGDADAQIALLVDHLMNLGLQPTPAPLPPALPLEPAPAQGTP
jgi:cytochrome c551/c552